MDMGLCRRCPSIFLVNWILLIVLALLPSSVASKKTRPNILLLLTDDQDVVLGGADYMPLLHTHLRQKGTTFDNAFVHTPICCPSRSSILSGRYLHNGGAINNSITGNCYGSQWKRLAEQRSFAVHAQRYGYRTSYAGKYLNQYGTTEKQPEVPSGWDKWYGLIGNSVYYNYTIVESSNGSHHRHTPTIHRHGDDFEHDYLPDLLANRTLAMIHEFASAEDSRPFLLVNAWPSCHAPFTPAPWADGELDNTTAPRTPNWNASYESVQGKHWFVRQMAAIDEAGEVHIDTIHQRRLETLLSVDRHIEQFVQALDSHNELNNTIIIFMSDNGFQLGQHRIESDKRQLYEHDIRIPFVVRGPGFAQNVTSKQVVLNIDIAPTIYDIVSSYGSNNDATLPAADAAHDMDGISFLRRRSSHDDDRHDFLVSYHGEGFAPCNMWECPPPVHMHDGDAKNNTFHCVRTLWEQENTIYCQFLDDEGFREYYDLNSDEWQLMNRYSELDKDMKWKYERRLMTLRNCHGESCRRRESKLGA